MGDHLAVQGSTRVVDFQDAVPLSEMVESSQYVRTKILDESTTTELVERLDAGDNVLGDCLGEIERLKKLGWDLDPPSRSDGC
jgi:hypothetical protein